MPSPADSGDTYITVHVCAGPGVLGRHGDLEGTFRRFLDVIVRSERVTLPPLLWEYVADHRYRTDDAGRTLCFGGPLREDMLERVAAWLHTIPKPQPGEQLWLRL
jgi:hypothetical protein